MYQLGYNKPTVPGYANTANLASPVPDAAIHFPGDPAGMNWLRPDHPYAAVVAPDGIESSVTFGADPADPSAVVTTVKLTSVSTKPIFTTVGDIGITLPLEDRYYDETDDYSIERHCNVHLFCGGTCSWALALRMSGKAPHLGLVLTEGALASYSVSRDLSKGSNDRGCFVLHPEALEFQPGESHSISWVIFPCASREDFLRQAAERSRFLDARWNRTVAFPGETATLRIRPSFAFDGDLTVNGTAVEPDADGGYTFDYVPTSEDVHTHDAYRDREGEHLFTVRAGDRSIVTRLFVSAPLNGLVAERARFIVRKQQYRGQAEHLRGTYLAYDNEDQRQYYYAQGDSGHVVNDYNAGRERVGMALLLLTYLRAQDAGLLDEADANEIRTSLNDYRAFVEREIVDTATGEVFNDAPRDNSYRRLYNAPWFAEYYTELYRLEHDPEDLRIAVRILTWFYGQGSGRFYPIELPSLALSRALGEAGLDDLREGMIESFVRHARNLAELGLKYPKHEVNYEQSIVAPAVSVILQAAELSGDRGLLEEGFRQLKVLDQFNGFQPDAHLNEVAIRHWDGFWFGKRKMYGDSFPHYWSGLTGNLFDLAADALSSSDADVADVAAAGAREAGLPADPGYWRTRATASRRALLQLFFPDGSASCAYVFPFSVNGERAHFADPMANDQDWALYFVVRALLEGNEA